TGALAAAGAAYDTLLDQAGVIRVDSMSDLFALATDFAHERLPAGPHVGILTNAGGPAIMATDACVTLGLDVVELPAGTQERLRRVLVSEASTRNPVDMVAGAEGSSYARALEILRDEPGLDALIVIFVSPIMINAVEVARAIIEAARRASRPILTCFMGKGQGEQAVEELRTAGVPVYMFPEEAARALAGLHRYRQIRSRPEGLRRLFDVDREGAATALAEASGAGRQVLLPEETERLLRAYGLPVVPQAIAADEKEAVAAAARIGYPVVLKGVAETLVHKTESGAVRLDLRSGAEVEQACRALRESLRQPALRFQVQKMVRGGVETILGIARDPKLGAILMFGLGGIFVEVMKDVVFRVLPIRDVEAGEMIRGVRGHALLAGARGAPPVDEAFLAEALLRLAQLAEEHPEIEQVDINPLLAGHEGASSVIVDARVRLAAR
ncbi:MAG TPA: acetate--CoA ligase family protein, partial [Candidatus Polarisedimenticolia bacterium]|nr:acetate--CoA ligase family protein [Candidatus Polarisedimenticolia bacterium]